jgi:transcriptional regulator with XRE-family HTH domain
VGSSRRRGWRGSGEFDRLIGYRLAQERRLAGLSEEELGDELGIGGDAVRAYERGEMGLTAPRLQAAAAALGMPMSLLFYPADQSVPSGERAGENQHLIAIPRPAAVLDQPEFAKVFPIITLWHAKHGELYDDVHRTSAIAACFIEPFWYGGRPTLPALSPSISVRES